jgi:hypothetical protein
MQVRAKRASRGVAVRRQEERDARASLVLFVTWVCRREPSESEFDELLFEPPVVLEAPPGQERTPPRRLCAPVARELAKLGGLLRKYEKYDYPQAAQY